MPFSSRSSRSASCEPGTSRFPPSHLVLFVRWRGSPSGSSLSFARGAGNSRRGIEGTSRGPYAAFAFAAFLGRTRTPRRWARCNPRPVRLTCVQPSTEPGTRSTQHPIYPRWNFKRDRQMFTFVSRIVLHGRNSFVRGSAASAWPRRGRSGRASWIARRRASPVFPRRGTSRQLVPVC